MAIESVVLVMVAPKGKPKGWLHQDGDEMVELVRSAGGKIVSRINAALDRPNPSHFIRQGKLEELRNARVNAKATLVIFNVDLSPVQARNIETACGVRVVDRTGLILDIFARRAQSKEGRLQVGLAQLNYLLPRLVGKGVIMSRLGGGIGTRGPGEQKLEVDRRQIRNRISRIKDELEKLFMHRELLRKARQRKAFKLVAIVGYTNAGKSTLMNSLTGSGVLVEDKLFATLDPTTRVFESPWAHKVLITDTVGFIKRLPHHLIEAFKATLEEVTQADALIHVVDGSNPFAEEQRLTVNQILKDLGADDQAAILALNKADLLTPEEQLRIEKKFPGGVLISAKDRKNLDPLIEKVMEKLHVGQLQ